MFGIPFEHCRGQGYDGASNFQGHFSGVAKILQDENAPAISVHCLAHCINLYLQDIAIKVSVSTFCYGDYPIDKVLTKKVSSFFKSSKRARQFSCIRIHPTRWTVHAEQSKEFLKIMSHFQETMETMKISSHGFNDCSRPASGILALTEKVKICFGLKLSVLIFSITYYICYTPRG